MGKHESFAPKALANKMKSVGLQKLRWYCQLCEKQCRDENGFKCHTQSESHLRQMRLFADNSGRIIHEFSQEFEKGFMQILSRHGSKRVSANKVYQEYIQDKNHIHMNATRWSTLTGLCMYLGGEGKAIVDETDKGWFIQYIDRDPEKAARQAALEARRAADEDEAEANNRMIEAQIAAAQKRLEQQGGDGEGEEGNNELVRDQEDKAPISLGLKVTTGAVTGGGGGGLSGLSAAVGAKKRLHNSAFASNDSDEEENEADNKKPKDKHATLGIKMPSFIPSALTSRGGGGGSASGPSRNEGHSSSSTSGAGGGSASSSSHMVQSNSLSSSSNNNHRSSSSGGGKANDRSKDSSSSSSDRKDYWLYPDLVVKVVSKRLSEGRYYKQKGVVLRVKDRYVGEVQLFDSKETITVDQNDLQTVISDDSKGATVLIVNGLGRGFLAKIVKVFEDDCDIRVCDESAGSLDDKLLTRVSLDDVCSLKCKK